MEEIKRGRVPWAAKKPMQKPGVGQVSAQTTQKARSAGRKKLPHLDVANVAFRGNVLTGNTIDSRKDLPPFGFNPSPKRAMARRAQKLASTYARSAKPATHPSSTQEIARLRDPKTRRAAMLQRALNTRPAVQQGFERKTVTKIVPDRRADGTITAYDPNKTSEVKASVGAMTNAPQHDFYAILAQMDEEVLRQANEVAKAQQQQSQSTSPSFYPSSAYLGSGLGLSSGDSQGMDGNWGGSEEEDGDGFNAGPPSSFGTQPLTGSPGIPSAVPYPTSGDGQSGSIDIKVQQVALLQQRVNQMYSLIGNMFSRYNQAATSTLQNLK